MFVCLCKALTEDDVASAARSCLASGEASIDALLEVLDLDCETACGFCTHEDRETFLAIAESAWSLPPSAEQQQVV